MEGENPYVVVPPFFLYFCLHLIINKFFFNNKMNKFNNYAYLLLVVISLSVLTSCNNNTTKPEVDENQTPTENVVEAEDSTQAKPKPKRKSKVERIKERAVLLAQDRCKCDTYNNEKANKECMHRFTDAYDRTASKLPKEFARVFKTSFDETVTACKKK